MKLALEPLPVELRKRYRGPWDRHPHHLVCGQTTPVTRAEPFWPCGNTAIGLVPEDVAVIYQLPSRMVCMSHLMWLERLIESHATSG